MGHRLSKIVTKTGDNGTTGLGQGERVLKNHAQIEAIGSIDELNSYLGLLIAQLPSSAPAEIKPCLVQIQHALFNVGGELCMPDLALITQNNITDLDTTLTALNETLPPLKEFILPGGNQTASTCHLARAVCRRAERRLVTLNQQKPLRAELLQYMNRLSDLLFIMARVLARQNGNSEVLWSSKRNINDHEQ